MFLDFIITIVTAAIRSNTTITIDTPRPKVNQSQLRLGRRITKHEILRLDISMNNLMFGTVIHGTQQLKANATDIGGSEIGHPASYLGTANFGTGVRHVEDLEEYHGQDIFLTEALTLEVNKAIQQAVEDGVPFLAHMAHYAVHSPFTLDSRFATNYPALTGNPLNFATMIEGLGGDASNVRAVDITSPVPDNADYPQ